MVNGCANATLRQVARVFRDGTLTGLSDRHMVERFIESGDEAAFEVLVARHGPMVFNVCRQLLRDPHDIEDAFQAVFLVLARKARMIRVEGSLGPWLYRVAHRVSARARANRRRRHAREIASAADAVASTGGDPLERDESIALIQEELARLPERLRAPLVLCYLQGMTHELAADQLGCPVGTVRSRLSRGREQLLRRVIRRGLGLSAVAVTAALESSATAAAVPAALRIALISLAAQAISGTTPVGGSGVSTSVVTLMEGVLNAMRIRTLAIVVTGLLGAAATGLFVADHAGRVEGATSDGTAQEKRVLFRRIGPDGRPIGVVVAGKAGSGMVTKTYYVGDIIGPPHHLDVPKTLPDGTLTNSDFDMKPLMNLICSTVAPGTWNVNDMPTFRGPGIEWSDSDTPSPNGEEQQNRMVPFDLSISLIVKSPISVHDEVANLLRKMRALLESRDQRLHDASKQHQASQPATLDHAIPSPTPAETNSATEKASRRRLEQLVDRLQKEIAKLPEERD